MKKNDLIRRDNRIQKIIKGAAALVLSMALLAACSGAESGSADPATSEVVEDSSASEASTADEEALDIDDSVDAEEEDKETDAAEEEDAEVDSEEYEEDEAANPEEYIAAYSELAKQLSESGEADLFRPVYVDQDDIPELAAISSEGSWDKDQVFLYTYYDGEARLLVSDIGPGMEGHSVSFFPQCNMIMKTGAAAGEAYSFYCIGYGEAEEFMTFSSLVNFDEDDNEQISYMIDGEEASEEEFEEQLGELLATDDGIKLCEVDDMAMIQKTMSYKDGVYTEEEKGRADYFDYDELLDELEIYR
ncbi:hypothetical protein [Butyrivibrio sp. MC2013]|uniref:hypothetical protein n=1 Tax=Butyrivibrio sp. MC2013 TaxID=1280686 RepID=UPI00041E2C65|nr:hypothetical protein [Butyrivibrio sp. MC2013]